MRKGFNLVELTDCQYKEVDIAPMKFGTLEFLAEVPSGGALGVRDQVMFVLVLR